MALSHNFIPNHLDAVAQTRSKVRPMERGFADFERGLTHLVETISVIDDLPYTFEQAVRRQGEQNVFRSLQRHFMVA